MLIWTFTHTLQIYEKAFDWIKPETMVVILQNKGIDVKDIRLIANLYCNQKTAVNIEGHCSEEIRTLRGLRQGYDVSPLLFNLYSEKLFKEAPDPKK